MAMFSSSTEVKRNFFRPQLSATYTGKDGVFKVYDLETRETKEVKELEMIYITGDVYTLEEVQVSKSNMVSNLYGGQKITLKNVNNWSVAGTYSYNKTVKKFLDEKGNEPSGNVKPFRHLIGIDKDGKIISLALGGSAMWDLTIRNDDKTNTDKIKTLKESNFITLKPAEELTKVYATTKIHLINVE